MNRRAVPFLAALLLAALPVGAAGAETILPVDLGAPVTGLRQAGDDVYVLAGRWLRLAPCGSTVCGLPAAPPRRASAPGGIPSGWVAEGRGKVVARAWYARPTTRYDHGVLGDAIEGGALVAVDGDGQTRERVLPDGFVFEDLAPRLVDLDGDGRDEIVTIRSDVRRGAALAVYGLAGGRLVERAALEPLGRSHRWLNVAGIADYSGDGRPDIALVKTPHIGGRLEVWTWRGGRLVALAGAEGYSNHAIGSSELGMAATADVDGDGVADLALPDARRSTLRIVTLAGGRLADIARVPLPARVVTAIGVMTLDGRPAFLAGLEGGRLVLVRP